MNIDKLEELTTNALSAMVDVINQKAEELRHLDVRYMVKEKSGKLPDFFELSGESQDTDLNPASSTLTGIRFRSRCGSLWKSEHGSLCQALTALK